MDFLNDITPLLARQPIALRGVAPSSAAKRRERFRHFAAWCAPLGLPSLPTTANILARYVGEHVGVVGFCTLRARVAAVKAVHLGAGAGWFDDEPVKWALEDARYVGGTRASLPLVEADLADLAALLVGDDTFAGVRDWALLAFGAFAGLDARELAALVPNDVVVDADGAWLPNMTSAWGEVPRVPRLLDARRCPVVALEVFRALRAPEAATLFHGFDAQGRAAALRAVDVNAMVARRMHAIGRDARRYSAASLKAHKFFGAAAARVRA